MHNVRYIELEQCKKYKIMEEVSAKFNTTDILPIPTKYKISTDKQVKLYKLHFHFTENHKYTITCDQEQLEIHLEKLQLNKA